MYNRPAPLSFVCAALLTAVAFPARSQPAACEYFVVQHHTLPDGRRLDIAGIADIPGDSLSVFMKAHSQRFSWLLQNRVDSLVQHTKTRSGTVEAAIEFCDALNAPDGIQTLFTQLIPGAGKKASQALTEAEMMQVAARFFYCDKTGPGQMVSPICIGNNGQKSRPDVQRYPLLEAFCFEAVYKNLRTESGKRFSAHFAEVRRAAVSKAIAEKVAPDQEQTFIREYVYAAMARDEDLHAALIQYYDDNRDNLGFVLGDSESGNHYFNPAR